MHGFSLNLLFEYFSKICRANSIFIKIWQEKRVLYTKPTRHFLSYLAQFFLEWRMFQTKFVEKNETHILCSITFFPENLTVYEIMWKYIVKPGSLQMTICRKRIACWIAMATNKQSQYVICIAFPRHNGCKNAPQYYVIRKLPFLLAVMRTSLNVHFNESMLCCAVLCCAELCCVVLCYIC